MKNCLDTDRFHLEYTESELEHPILWESHCHAQYEIIAVTDGDITVMLEGENYRLKKNQLIIIPPLFYHSVTANDTEKYSRITALFDIEAIPKVLQAEFVGKSRGTASAGAQMEKLKEICRKNEPLFYAPLIQSLMTEIFYDAEGSPRAPAKSETDEFIQRTIQYIDLHLQEKIMLDDLAKHCSRSKSSFCHLFEEKMNISPKQYILQKKLALASKLISEGSPPTSAAMQIGYENYSNFYRIYLKNFGKSPRK